MPLRACAFGVRAGRRASRTASGVRPDVRGDRDRCLDLRPLLGLAVDVALLGRGGPALRAERELIQGGDGGRLVDAALEVVRALEGPRLGGDQAELDDLVTLGEEPQGLEASGALVVVLE